MTVTGNVDRVYPLVKEIEMNYATQQWNAPSQLAFILSQMDGRTEEDAESMAQHLKHAYQLGSIKDCRKLVQTAVATEL